MIVFDEPTAILTEREARWLFDIIKRLRARGVAIVYISHRLEEVFAIADRVTILKDGETKGTWPIGGVTTGALIEVMAGQALTRRRRSCPSAARRTHSRGSQSSSCRSLPKISVSTYGPVKSSDSSASSVRGEARSRAQFSVKMRRTAARLRT